MKQFSAAAIAFAIALSSAAAQSGSYGRYPGPLDPRMTNHDFQVNGSLASMPGNNN